MTKQLTVLISGGTSGVGKAIAKSFAQRNADVTLIGRNVARAQQAVTELQQLTGNPNISYLIGDLADKRANQKLADEFKLTHAHLDVLVNSAGSIPKTATENINLNLRSHYWLTHNLVDLLSAAPTMAHVFIITGMPLAIYLGPIYERQNTLLDRGLWLLTHKTLLVRLLADQLSSHHVAVNALFPGGVQSNLSSWNQSVSNNEVLAAARVVTDPQLQTITGGFFSDKARSISLNHRKYSVARAKKILTPYL
ncbi:SDR family NAD(P)-dependent oxidoreductase [Furfurilactobacillus siliginis]|nr:SDR family NAD(P)-dependent oxidoreductase [Furfurilactobacillus siliginis]GEK28254.1 short-chain dehydrogenase [Furfurilactobacillus siliginis]